MGGSVDRAHTQVMTENDSTLPPPPAATPVRRVRRSLDDRELAGVAGGIARHFDVDATLVRLAFVALAVFGGSGLLFYAIAWVIIPSDAEAPVVPAATASNASTSPTSTTATGAASTTSTEPASTDDTDDTGDTGDTGAVPFTVFPMV